MACGVLKNRAVVADGWAEIPRHYIFLNLDPKESMRRKQGFVEGGGEVNHFDQASYETLVSRRRRYQEFFEVYCEPEMVTTIGASRTKDEVYDDMLAAVKKLLP